MSHYASVHSMDDRGMSNMFMDPLAPQMGMPNSSMSFEFDNFGIAPQAQQQQQPAAVTSPTTLTPTTTAPVQNLLTQQQAVTIASVPNPNMQHLGSLEHVPNHGYITESHTPISHQSDNRLLVQEHVEHGGPLVVEETQPSGPEIDIAINNVVCSFSTKCHLNLRRIAMDGMHVILKKECGMVSMKLRNPRTTASIWSSGKITCTGATSEDESKRAARRFARTLQKLGFKTRVANFRVVNVLGTCSLPFAINIAEFSRNYPREASYEPELHPGVTYRLVEPKATLKIFSTGSITVTAPRVANVQAAIEHIFPLVYVFKRDKKQLTKRDMIDADLYVIPDNVRKRHLMERQRQLVYKRQRFDDSDQEDWTDTDEEYDSDDSFE